MNRVRMDIFLVFGSLAGCVASVPPPVAKQAASETAVQRAREAGAADVPEAMTHLQYAEEELENGRALMRQGDNQTAAHVLDRARIEADLAVTSARVNRAASLAEAPAPIAPVPPTPTLPPIAQAPTTPAPSPKAIPQTPTQPSGGAIGGGPPPVSSPSATQTTSATQTAAVETAAVGQTQQPLERADEAVPATRKDPAEEKAARAESEKKAREALEKIAIMGVGSVRIDDRGTVISMPASKLFVGDSTTIAPAARDNLELVADAAKGPDDHKIVVEGFTDSQGNAAASKELSQRRADAVRELLVSRGVPADRVRAQGLGGVRPIADNGTVAGRAKNHRVEILVQAIVEAAGGPEGSRRVTPK
jgi:outer membrane protein OmpA-like peptidoglycan-associated protein